jgi:hypothetical protein
MLCPDVRDDYCNEALLPTYFFTTTCFVLNLHPVKIFAEYHIADTLYNNIIPGHVARKTGTTK